MTKTPSNIGRRFRLIGNTTEFRVVAEYLAAGFIPALVGVTDDNGRKTQPRVADVVWLSDDRRASFTTTPSKIAQEHAEEVRDLTAQGIAAARRHELTAFRSF